MKGHAPGPDEYRFTPEEEEAMTEKTTEELCVAGLTRLRAAESAVLSGPCDAEAQVAMTLAVAAHDDLAARAREQEREIERLRGIAVAGDGTPQRGDLVYARGYRAGREEAATENATLRAEIERLRAELEDARDEAEQASSQIAAAEAVSQQHEEALQEATATEIATLRAELVGLREAAIAFRNAVGRCPLDGSASLADGDAVTATYDALGAALDPGPGRTLGARIIAEAEERGKREGQKQCSVWLEDASEDYSDGTFEHEALSFAAKKLEAAHPDANVWTPQKMHDVLANARTALATAERERDEALAEAGAWRAKARDKGEAMREAQAERDALAAKLAELSEKAEAVLGHRDSCLDARSKLEGNRAQKALWASFGDLRTALSAPPSDALTRVREEVWDAAHDYVNRGGAKPVLDEVPSGRRPEAFRLLHALLRDAREDWLRERAKKEVGRG